MTPNGNRAWTSSAVPHGNPGGERYLSTNHLMGHGYWVWLIPLASGSTSIGIVADADIHPHAEFNTLDRALEWLRIHEPQCAAAIDEHRDDVQDFRIMRDYAYGCKQVYSDERWCLTGEAGISIDPLYSSGGDLMGISNGFIVDLIRRDRAGEDIRQPAVAHNQVYLVLGEIWLSTYDQNYQLMGNPQVMVAKVIWDTMVYWAVPGLLFFSEKLPRLGESPAAMANLFRAWKLHTNVQKFVREWLAVDNAPAEGVSARSLLAVAFAVRIARGNRLPAYRTARWTSSSPKTLRCWNKSLGSLSRQSSTGFVEHRTGSGRTDRRLACRPPAV